MPVRILFLADTHLGFDLPVAARIRRRRRGQDFLGNYLRALAPALDGDVDAVVHGGDVFHRPRVAATLAMQAFDPLRRIAEQGSPGLRGPGQPRARPPSAPALRAPPADPRVRRAPRVPLRGAGAARDRAGVFLRPQGRAERLPGP